MTAQQASSRLEMLQARFQQRQLAEKEQKLLQLYDQQQLRAHQVAQRGSAGSNDSNGSAHGNNGNVSHHQTVTRTSTSTHTTSNSQGGGKVRQMFDERRQTTVKGFDKSYPLEPLDNRSRKHQTITSNLSVNAPSPLKNGNPANNSRTVITRRTVRSEAESDVNCGKPMVSYHEEVSQEIIGSLERDDEQEEFGDENYRVSRHENGNRRIDRADRPHMDDVANKNTTQRHRTTAKIHMAAVDRSNVNDKTNYNNPESEQFPEDEMISTPENFPRRSSAEKKSSQIDSRFERLKNSTVKKIGQTSKPIAANTTSFTKKRNETTLHSGSSSRTVTRRTEEDFPRASSKSPQLEGMERSKESLVDPRYPGSKTSGITKVSQLCHDNRNDYYPRRKSEFEKSKTFRKLQLELGESSPEPNEPEQLSSFASSVKLEKQCRRKSPILDENVYSSHRRSTSTSPELDFAYSKEGKRNREKSPELPGSRRGSQSPTWRRESISMKISKNTTTDEGMEKSRLETKTHSSRRCSSPSRPSVNRDFSKRKTSLEKSAGLPSYRKESTTKDEENKISGEIKKSNFESSTFSSRRHSSTWSPVADNDLSKERNKSRERSPQRPESAMSGKRCESPIDRRESRIKKSSFDSSTYSSKHYSDTCSPIAGRDYSRERKTSHEKSYEDLRSPERSQSPNCEGESTMKNNSRRKKSHFETSTFSSRNHASSPTNTAVDRNFSEERKTSHEISHEYRSTRERSASPNFHRESLMKNTETNITSDRTERNGEHETPNYETSTYSSRCHSSSPNSLLDHDFPKDRYGHDDRDEEPVTGNRRNSGETLRSFELLKKIGCPSNVEKKPKSTSATHSAERKITLEDIEFPGKSMNLRDERKRSKSPEHKIVKKDRAVMRTSEQDKSIKVRERKDSRATRSRTVSPSPASSGAIRERASLGAKKSERNISNDAKKTEFKNRQDLDQMNLYDKRESCKLDLDTSLRIDGKDSRRSSSSEVTVKRNDTFKVARPSQRVLKIESEKISEKDSSFSKDTRGEKKDKGQLRERIEKIRSTLSRSGRSDQTLHSKEFERTDSVESALKRFDSIGVETEHRVTVGVDETDTRKPVIEKVFVKKTIKPLCKPSKVTGAAVKTQPRKIGSKSGIVAAKDKKTTRVNLREKHGEASKTSKTKKEKSVITTPRQRDNKMVSKSHEGQKKVTSFVKKSKLRSGEEFSGRGECRNTEDSPLCKRKLFQTSDWEIENENSGPTVVLNLVEIESRNNRENVTKSVQDILRSESSPEESRIGGNEPTTVLRSIEDIRKSIKRESEDFKRELKKFNTAMRGEEKISSMDNPRCIPTSGFVSSVRITKTMKSGDREPIIKVERSTVKLPINHRVAKSPSPDIGTKRSMEGTTRTRTSSSIIRGTVSSSSAKSPDTSNRYGSSEVGTPGTKSLGRTSEEYSDDIDGATGTSEVTITEVVSTTRTTKGNNDAFVIDFNDDDISRSRDISLNRGKLAVRRGSSDRSLTSQKQNRSPTTTPLARPTSALSTASSINSARGQSSQITSKNKMSSKAKSASSNALKASTPTSNPRASSQSAEGDGLAPCKICGRRFNSDRVNRHEQICSKTTTKKRKQFDATTHRIKGTELEPFVKKGGTKKSQADRKAQKPEVKSNWRRKHEDFINAIRSAKQVQAHLAAGGKLSDLPPPPPSDTSDYVQCPHCGRKFNQAAADRHIPKCQSMMHNKPNPRAPPKPKR